MIKISKDNLFYLRLFGIGIIAVDIIITIFIIGFHIWIVFIPMFFFAIGHFVIGRVWRYLYIVDVYLSENFQCVTIKDFNGVESKFDCSQAIKCTTRFGVTDLVIDNDGKAIKFYFAPNSRENLKYFPNCA